MTANTETTLSDEVIRSKEYFDSEKFDCTPAFLLNELAVRAAYWSKLTDGSYCVPTGETGQIYEMAIAAIIKNSAIPVLRELELDDLEIIKRIAVIEGDESTVNTFAFYDSPEHQTPFYLNQREKVILSQANNPLNDKSLCFELMAKHSITRINHLTLGWCYQATEGDLTLIPTSAYGEQKANCLAVLAKNNQLKTKTNTN